MVLIENDVDDFPFMFFHMVQQILFAGGFKSTDTAAEEQNTVFGAKVGLAWSLL